MSDDNRPQELPETSDADNSMEYEREMQQAEDSHWIDIDSDEDEISSTYSGLEREDSDLILERCPSCSTHCCHHWCDECEVYHGENSDDEDIKSDIVSDDEGKPTAMKNRAPPNLREKAEERRNVRELRRFSMKELQVQLDLTIEKLRFIDHTRKTINSDMGNVEKALMRKAHLLRHERTCRQDCVALHTALYEKMQQREVSSGITRYLLTSKSDQQKSSIIVIT
jgi:hypothetical protein